MQLVALGVTIWPAAGARLVAVGGQLVAAMAQKSVGYPLVAPSQKWVPAADEAHPDADARLAGLRVQVAVVVRTL